jgi:hypothetical protein
VSGAGGWRSGEVSLGGWAHSDRQACTDPVGAVAGGGGQGVGPGLEDDAAPGRGDGTRDDFVGVCRAGQRSSCGSGDAQGDRRGAEPAVDNEADTASAAGADGVPAPVAITGMRCRSLTRTVRSGRICQSSALHMSVSNPPIGSLQSPHPDAGRYQTGSNQRGRASEVPFG